MALRKRKPTSRDGDSNRSRTSPRSPRPGLRRPPRAPAARWPEQPRRKTARHRGAGHKQQYRLVDFHRDKAHPRQGRGDRVRPNRNARIALCTISMARSATSSRQHVSKSATSSIGPSAEIRPGNASRCLHPGRSVIHNVELRPGGGKLARGAGISVQLVAKEGMFATLRLPSTEMRRVPIDCRGTLGRGRQPEAELVPSGRRAVTAGRASAQTAGPDEPGRPPARRWRGELGGRIRCRRGASRGSDRPRHKRSTAHHPSSPQLARPPLTPSGDIMPRSLKKGPFVDDHLLRKVDALNSPTRSVSSRPGRVARRSSRTWSATRSRFTTAASTCRCT